MDQEPTLLAKVICPTLPDVFIRKRLFDLLDDMRERTVLWVSGPPGCGKTTLLGSYIETLKIPCLWYNFDKGDADPATFFYYMGLAAKKVAPRMRKSLPLRKKKGTLFPMLNCLTPVDNYGSYST